MKALELQKQILIAESELNRAQLVEDVVALRISVHSFADRAKSLGSIVSSVTTLALGLAGRCRGKPANSDTKLSWLQIILKGAGLVSNILPLFQSQDPDRQGR